MINKYLSQDEHKRQVLAKLSLTTACPCQFGYSVRTVAATFSRAKSPAYTLAMIASSLASQTQSHSLALLDIFQGDSSGEAPPVTPFSKPLVWFHAGWSFSLSFWPEGRTLTKWRSQNGTLWGNIWGIYLRLGAEEVKQAPCTRPLLHTRYRYLGGICFGAVDF